MNGPSLGIARLQTHRTLDAEERDRAEQRQAHQRVDEAHAAKLAKLRPVGELYETTLARLVADEDLERIREAQRETAAIVSGVDHEMLERNARERRSENARAVEELHASAPYLELVKASSEPAPSEHTEQATLTTELEVVIPRRRGPK